MGERKSAVAELRYYSVKNTEEAKAIVRQYLADHPIVTGKIRFGLPEINDRFHY